jgi:NAD(P)-dependent dehydrogenase (short-subunit alcohol dehydrogenase family)
MTDEWVERQVKRATSKGMTDEEATTKTFTLLDNLVPLGRIAQPDDVAKVVAFLASSDSDYMTGQAINVTGGQLMCH